MAAPPDLRREFRLLRRQSTVTYEVMNEFMKKLVACGVAAEPEESGLPGARRAVYFPMRNSLGATPVALTEVTIGGPLPPRLQDELFEAIDEWLVFEEALP